MGDANMMLCEQVQEFSDALEEVMVKTEDGIKLMPELYAVPADKVSRPVLI